MVPAATSPSRAADARHVDRRDELGELLADAGQPAGPGASASLHETDAFTELADKYHITYGNPPWMDDIIARYHLNPPTH